MNAAADCHEIPDCPGCYVDAFRGRYLPLTKKAENLFVLTHYHGDHYGSLPRENKYEGPAAIHCTPVTAALLRTVHQVPARFVVEHAYGETWQIFVSNRRTTSRKRKALNTECSARDDDDDDDQVVKITFYDANHCPGAAIVAFQLNDGRVHLHTGDMRYHPKMKSYPLLQQAAMNRQIDLVFLDTTYGNPKHDFCAQEEAINTIATHVEGLLGSASADTNTTTLVLLSCYSIGKERVLWEASQRTNQQIFVQDRKYTMLQCIQEDLMQHVSSNIIDRCTQDSAASDIHVIPMGLAGEMWPYFQPNHWACADYARKLDKKYKQVVAFLPTGWADATNWNKKNGVSRKTCDGIEVEIRLVAYSEHSSFSELQEFVGSLKPRKVIPTVYKDENDKRKIQARFKVDSQRAKLMFLQSFGSPIAAKKKSKKSENKGMANGGTTSHDNKRPGSSANFALKVASKPKTKNSPKSITDFFKVKKSS